MPELSKLQRELISRGAMVALALVLLFGGYACLRKARQVAEGHRARTEQNARPVADRGLPEPGSAGAGVLNLIGYALLLAGGVFVLMAVLPPETFGRIMGPPNTTLYDNPGLDKIGRWLQ